MSKYFDRLKKVVIAELNPPEDKIVPEASFRDDLGATSVEIFDLILAVEDEFGIEVPDEEAVMITTVADALAYLDKRLG
ncbi:MAG: acyl carrier protein [bacterium]